MFSDSSDVRVYFHGGIWYGKEGAKRLYIDRFQKTFTHGRNGPRHGTYFRPQLPDHQTFPPFGLYFPSFCTKLIPFAFLNPSFVNPLPFFIVHFLPSSFSSVPLSF